MKIRKSNKLLALAALGLACSSKASLDPSTWSPDEVVGYRLLTKEDFRAGRSSKVWGNIAHGAEICTLILPVEGSDEVPRFRAVMNPECSFWNDKVGPLGTLGGLSGVSVVPGIPTQQPDWYVLQHEQIHFAIMEVAARTLTKELSEAPAASRSQTAVTRAYQLAMAGADDRHARFDAATSGTFDPPRLGVWVRALEKEMRRLCGWEAHCWVRHQTPMGWGD